MRLLRRYWWVIAIVAAVVVTLRLRVYLERVPVDGDVTYSRVEEGLFVGGRVGTPPEGTGAVLCLSYLEDPYRGDVAEWNWQPIADAGPAPSLEWLRKQVAFVAEQRKAGRQVYVHCDAGMSRSAMVTVAYLMWAHQWARDKALAFLRERRPNAYPNKYFMALLLEWEGETTGEVKPAAASQGGGKLE